MRAWVLLCVSSLLQAGWIVSLKLTNGFSRILPTIGNVVFGLGAALLLSLSLKDLSMGTAYAAWTGLSLVGALVLDVVLFHEPIGRLRLACAVIIVVASLVLRLATPPAPKPDPRPARAGR